MTKTRIYPTVNNEHFSGYKLIASGGKIYRNLAAKPDALPMIIIPAIR